MKLTARSLHRDSFAETTRVPFLRRVHTEARRRTPSARRAHNGWNRHHGIPLVAPGSSLHRELELLAASRLSPYEVLRSATVVPAAFLNKSKEFGTIAVGQRADLLLVNSNPLENLTVLQHPNGVMVRGKWLPRQKIDELLKRLAGGE